MKIGVICYPTYGGSGVVATELGKQMAKLGHQIHFIATDKPFRMSGDDKNLFFHKVPIEPYPIFEFEPYETAMVSKILDVMENESLDILHAHYAIPHSSSCLFAQHIFKKKRGIKVPLITTLHGTDVTLIGHKPSFLNIIKFALDQSDAVTCVSNFLKQETLTQFKPKQDIEVIANFVDFDFYNNTLQQSVSFWNKPYPTLTHISNFRKVKNVDKVVRVMGKLIKDFELKLILVGDGPEKEACEKLAKSLDVYEHILFLGKQTDLRHILCQSTLFLFPSQIESFGLAPLEAMAAGVPVLCSDTGGLKELVENGKSGFLCPIDNIEDCMVEKALLLLKNKDYLNQMSHEAGLRAKNFDAKTIVPKYEALYKKILLR